MKCCFHLLYLKQQKLLKAGHNLTEINTTEKQVAILKHRSQEEDLVKNLIAQDLQELKNVKIQIKMGIVQMTLPEENGNVKNK